MSKTPCLAACCGTIALIVGSSAFAQRGAIPLIDREVLFGNPDRASVQISPDGRQLAWLGPKEGVLNVWVAPVNDIDAAQCVTNDTYRGIRNYTWAFNNSHIVYLQDTGGDENFLAYSVNLSSNETQPLTPFEGSRVSIQQTSWKYPDEMILAINKRNPAIFDLYRANVVTGELKLIRENPDEMSFTSWITDEDFNVRLAQKFSMDGGNEWYTVNEDGSTELWQKVSMEDTLTTGWGGFDKTGSVLYGIDSRDRDTGAATATNLKTGKTTILASDPRADAGGFVSHPTENTVQAISFTYDRVKWTILDDAISDDFAYLRTVADGDFNITSRSIDDKTWTLAYVLDSGPVEYYLYDNEHNKAKFLFTNRTKLENLPLAKMHPTIIKSRDGLNLVGYYTLPVQTDTDEDGIPDEPLATVLFVHGGPWARDSWGYNPYHQWLANRGYAVLSVNYRGSTGFGKNFINAGNHEWAAKMHNDLLDAVDWAIGKGIADETRIGIMGGSYGGYATLVGVTFTPDKFACGVDIVGPSNIITLLNTIPPYWKPAMELFKRRVGDHTTEEGREFLMSRSPISRVDQIKKPLLIGQGANDPRVNQDESDQIVKAMRKKNIPVTYVLFPDEGHGFARPENRMAFNAVTEGFLAQHLGGRYQPIDDDFNGSTVTIPEGANQVPGVTDALNGR